MYRLMYRTWRTQCIGPCALILLVLIISSVTFHDPRPHKTGKIVPKNEQPQQQQQQQSRILQDQTLELEGHKPDQVQGQLPKLSSNQYINPHDFRYIIENPSSSMCDSSDVFLLIFVHSAAGHFLERKRIRNTWSSVRTYQERDIRTVFLLAKPADAKTQDFIEQENDQFGDIVQEDFVDHYRNLTYKHIMGLKWVTQFCSHTKTVVKVDDDTFVHIFRLVQFLSEDPYFSLEEINIPQRPRRKSKYNHAVPLRPNDVRLKSDDVIYCSVFRSMSARRDQSDKWYVSRDEYPDDKYPTWCEGFAYVIKPSVVRKLYETSLRTKYFWIDDVYVTGILTQKLDVRHRQFRNPWGYGYLGNAKPPYNDFLFLLDKYNPHSSDIWYQVWNASSTDRHFETV